MRNLLQIERDAINAYLGDRSETQSELANKLGVSQATVARWLNGTAQSVRHSFCTYHVALYGDAGRTATLLTQRGIRHQIEK